MRRLLPSIPRQRSSLALASPLLLLGCFGDDLPTNLGGSGSTGVGGSSSTGLPTTTGESTTTGAQDSTSSGSTGSSGSDGESSSSTGMEPVDPNCPGCITLVEGLEEGRGLSLHGDFVYFTDQADGTVNRVPKGGGELEELANLQMQPYDVVANDDQVFWTTFVDGGSVWRANLPSGPPIALSADGFPRMLQLHGDHVYWCAFDEIEGRVRRVSTAGIGNPPQTLVAVGSGVADLVVYGSNVYFTVHEPPDMPGLAPPGVVYLASAEVPTDVADLEWVALDQSEPWGIAAAADTIFWVNGLGNPDDQPKSVLSSTAAGGGGPGLLALDQTAPWGIAADDSLVYWTDWTNVKAIPHAGGDEIMVAQMQYLARSIAVDDTDVFWITKEKVMQRPKPER
ncbi:type 2 periplasmic-binding domain-containing protein [Paraliomyxa miuraensis]|uniref:hypothetical protein n=1 Tax=Paraliomyxa miuraensis TaxID=376150 RepID=UPI0022513A80|nr:hypothetical protein [Paraliomyxa miuraensis]MCX4245576.1 hypothetical protein [Paraliomyxa miuraensis]